MGFTIGQVTAALGHEYPAVDGAFFDDFDGSVCPFESAYDQLPTRYTTADRLAMHAAKMATFGRVAARLIGHGQYPIFAMAAVFNTTEVAPEYRCQVQTFGHPHCLARMGTEYTLLRVTYMHRSRFG